MESMGPTGPRPGWLGRKGLHCTLLMRWSLVGDCPYKNVQLRSPRKAARPIVGGRGSPLRAPNEKPGACFDRKRIPSFLGGASAVSQQRPPWSL